MNHRKFDCNHFVRTKGFLDIFAKTIGFVAFVPCKEPPCIVVCNRICFTFKIVLRGLGTKHFPPKVVLRCQKSSLQREIY